jgi:hypothetical protein
LAESKEVLCFQCFQCFDRCGTWNHSGKSRHQDLIYNVACMP